MCSIKNTLKHRNPKECTLISLSVTISRVSDPYGQEALFGQGPVPYHQFSPHACHLFLTGKPEAESGAPSCSNS